MLDARSAMFKTNPEVGNLVSFLGGKVGVFLGLRATGLSLSWSNPSKTGGRDVFCILSENLDRPDLIEIDYLARLYRGGMQFYDGSAKPDTRIDSKIEDMVQSTRGRAYELATIAIQRIRELNEPHSVDGISVCLDFLERTGADAQAIENERAALAEARERRRVEMGYEPFDAHTYYAGLRAIGAEPCVRRYEHGGSLVEIYLALGANRRLRTTQSMGDIRGS